MDVPKPTGQPESQERSRILIQIQFVFPLSLVHNNLDLFFQIGSTHASILESR